MKVLKFGGTSVGTVESLQNVKKIVDAIPGKAIIVVSALGGLTDHLIATAQSAASGSSDWKQEMIAIEQRHFHIIDNMVPENLKSQVKEKVASQLEGLKRNYEGLSLLRALPEKILDTIVSYGERMSSVIVAAMIQNGKRYYSPDFIKTEKRYGKNAIADKTTRELILKEFKDMADNEKAIVPGFISTDISSGEITNLGRGGSDFTGALIAAALDADSLEIWTDVDGFMTADPRTVKNALIIPHLTFSESMELCTFGAKVIYPPTIYPVFHKNIPIKILNTFNPEAPGTLINEKTYNDDFDIKGVSPLKDVSLISIDTLNKGNHEEIATRAFNVLSRQAVRIIPVANHDPASQLLFSVHSPLAEKCVELLENEFAPEISASRLSRPELKSNMAAIALVGRDMKTRKPLMARVIHSLQRQGINVEAQSSGNSSTTMLFLIDQGKCPVALPLIHDMVF